MGSAEKWGQNYFLHYRKGVSYYLSENLDKAIQEWEEVLRLRPDDPKAKKDLLNARRLKEKSNKF